jgi:ribosomal protein S18 acetylase RimI-like enzyme
VVIKCIDLDDLQRTAVQNLLLRCKTEDQVTVSLEMDKSLNHYKDLKSWLLFYTDEVLIGVLSIFEPLSMEAEITGCIQPDQRRKGYFNILLSEAENELSRFKIKRLLFAIDGKSESGEIVMQKKGYRLVHKEYGMRYWGKPASTTSGRYYIAEEENHDDGIGYRSSDTVLSDIDTASENPVVTHKELCIQYANYTLIDEMAVISAAAFHEAPQEASVMLRNGFMAANREHYAAFMDDKMIGIVSIKVEAGEAVINGLSIDPQAQGKGYGTAFMTKLIDMLLQRDLSIALEVDSENKKAYQLYKKLGFLETDVKDYYEKML